jgi:hypothetical protein
MSKMRDILAERGARYGEFKDHADITQSLKDDMGTSGWLKLRNFQKEALDMIAHKIGRIINGDPDYVDSWTDICGFSQLVVDILEKEQAVTTVKMPSVEQLNEIAREAPKPSEHDYKKEKEYQEWLRKNRIPR